MSELLFEIFSEEIPARMQLKAAEDFKILVEKSFKSNQIAFSELKSFVTPRRLVVIACGIKIDQLEGAQLEKKGPNVEADDAVVDAFAYSMGVDRTELFTKCIRDKEYYFARSNQVSKDIRDLLPKAMERALGELSWAKSMKWDQAPGIRWVRPIRNIMCVFDGEVLPIRFGNLNSNDISFGHRFMAPTSFKVKNFSSYNHALQEKSVILNSADRKQIILSNINRLTKELGVELIEDEGLLDEVCGLIEYPFVLFGKIDNEFLSLPKEVLISCMRKHQKYFSLKNSDGTFAPYFIVVSNNITQDAGKEIIAGNEKVLKARLKDAKFFIEEDRKTTLDSKVEKLKGVVYHQKLGSMYDKAIRVSKLAKQIYSEIKLGDEKIIERIVRLSKVDLTSGIVGEFPELQGIAGAYYATFDNESNAVAKGIYEHYLPTGKDSYLPTSIEGAIVSIADKMDSIAGMFSIGEVPTSSKDPYALRRHALGVIRILCEYKIDFPALTLIKNSLDLYNHSSGDTRDKMYNFFFDRFKYWLKDHFREDYIAAILKKSSRNIHVDYLKIKELNEFLLHEESSKAIFAIKRIINIIENNQYLFAKMDGEIDSEIFSTSAEKSLLFSIENLQDKIINNITSHKYLNALELIYELKDPIDKFFNDVMVMVDDINIKINRLKILKKIYNLVDGFIAFSLIEL